LITRNYEKINTALPLTFANLENYIQINYDGYIYVTKGTYSKDILIRSSDDKPFRANMRITAQ